MFLLNQRSVQHLLHLKLNLHSTMFLLNQDGSEYNEDVVTYLHSTMFLLNRNDTRNNLKGKLIYIPLCFY